MTEARADKPKRLSRGVVRLWAWVAGALAFFSPWVALGLNPKPAALATGEEGRPRIPHRPVIIVHKITRRIVVQDPPADQPVQYVYSGGGSTSSSTSSSSSGGGGTYQAPPPPTTNTGGS